MKTIQNTFTILIFLLTSPLFGQMNIVDTVFIQKDSVLGTAQSIYFDYNRNSKFYDQLNYWTFDKFDTLTYLHSLDYLKEKNFNLNKSTPVISTQKWVSLYKYKGKYYVYKPCDFLFHYKVSINDTTYIEWTGEGPVANKIIEQKKLNSSTYQFKLASYFNEDLILTIHFIYRKEGIAVFKQANNSNQKESFQFLMIAADKIKSVPIIVNNCEFQKEGEFNFDDKLPCIPIIIDE